MQLMRRFAKKTTVLYVNSIVMQKPGLGKGKRFFHKVIRKLKSIATGLKKSDAGFWVYSPFTLPVHHIKWAGAVNIALLRWQINLVCRKLKISQPVVWVACPAAWNVVSKISRSKLVYQRTDRHEYTPNVDTRLIELYDRELKTAADITLYSSTSLYEEELSQCKNAFFLDHGVDFQLFAFSEQNNDPPADIAGIKRPIAGYFGGISDHKLDFDLITTLAKLLPEVAFVFVGDAPRECREVLASENIWLLGQKPYEQIPHYGKCFDVAILPWRPNKWTEAANPIKLKEYLALGKPIVSTSAFAELQQYIDVVYEANGPEDFAEAIKKALGGNCPERVALRRKRVQESSWNSKAQIVWDELCKT
ncbi:MAG: hypothetical protein DRP65_02265 [Planctomycetota bacterium]|nr:MAG: hypothetical protein DRP65_02265 [Planctomycetota bacterium]